MRRLPQLALCQKIGSERAQLVSDLHEQQIGAAGRSRIHYDPVPSDATVAFAPPVPVSLAPP